jgi:hypothetical protein
MMGARTARRLSHLHRILGVLELQGSVVFIVVVAHWHGLVCFPSSGLFFFYEIAEGRF